jgi:cytochrome b involved in lipid metabolism
MKKLISISLFIFWVVVVAILIAGLVFYQNNKNFGKTDASSSINETILGNKITPSNQTILGNQAAVSSLNTSGSMKTILSLTEIAKHNSANDCWLLINNKVYDVTSAIDSHPGGAETIIPNCGKEATQAFDTKEIGRPHSNRASSMLDNLYIGDLNQSITF